MLGWRYKDTDPSKFVGWGYQNPLNSVPLTVNTVAQNGFGTPLFFSWKHNERVLCPDEFLQMRFKLADDLKLRLRQRSILRYLLSQFPNGHLFEAFYKRISLCLLNEKFVNWRTWRTLYPPLILINVTHSIWTLNKCIWITKMVFSNIFGLFDQKSILGFI